MFGRKSDEDYDAYNEKYSAKYDDDYVAPSEEYRSECSHSHEQTYDDITNVEDCDHSHEQSYSDADTEQKPYDDYVSIESVIEPYLMQDEHLIWVGGKNPSDKTKQKNPNSKGGVIMLVISIVLMVTVFLASIGIVLLILSIVVLSGASPGTYGITDKRVILIDAYGKNFIGLDNIKDVSSSVSNNGKGNLTISLRHHYKRYNKVITTVYMYGISDPKRVERILKDAVYGFAAQKRR